MEKDFKSGRGAHRVARDISMLTQCEMRAFDRNQQQTQTRLFPPPGVDALGAT
jgi:hypothetical protein